MAEIVLDHVSKVYPSAESSAVADLNLEIGDGEFIVLVGPSGCGKTTALRMVAGLESITDGTISIGDRVVNTVPPKERDIAMVFQNYALYPHMTVFDNMAFGLKLRKVPKTDIDRRVREAANILGLEEFLERKPSSPLGRATSAGGDGPRDRPRTEGLPDGRTALQPRREAPRPDAVRDRADPTRAQRHDAVRDPRPGRGDDDGRPGRGDQEGRAPADRHAAVPVRPPDEPVRRRVHRLTLDEHGRGHPLPRRRFADGGVRRRQDRGPGRRPRPAPGRSRATRGRRSFSGSAPRTWRTPLSFPRRPRIVGSAPR